MLNYENNQDRSTARWVGAAATAVFDVFAVAIEVACSLILSRSNRRRPSSNLHAVLALN
jgi:hypothetical protein